MKDIENCTRCGKKFDGLRIEIEQKINTQRQQNTTDWEPLPNLRLDSYEILCQSCFDKYSKIMEQMNISKEERFPKL